jgi:hypothetical protein
MNLNTLCQLPQCIHFSLNKKILLHFSQDGFLNAATLEEAPSSVLDRVVKLAVDNFDELLPSELESIFKSGFSDQTSDLATRISFKVIKEEFPVYDKNVPWEKTQISPYIAWGFGYFSEYPL